MNENVITVNKTVSEKVSADFVTITVTAYGEAKKYGDAVEKATSAADGVICSLKGAGFEARAVNVNVSPVREGKRIVSYRAARGFTVGFDFEKEAFGKALSVLTDVECEWNVAFSLKDGGERAKLLERAVRSAREDAETIAKAAGVKLGTLAGVEYSSGDNRPMLYRAAMRDGAANDVEPNEITLSESVGCSWKIEQ